MPQNLKSLLLYSALLLSSASYALGYGGEGHRAVGLMAQQRLNQRAATAIAALLKNDKCKELACIATWPDDLKLAARKNKGPLAGNKEAMAFQTNFPTNDGWHFVKGQQSDIGGNDLTFNGGELHAFWDACLIQRLTGNQLCVGEEQMEKQGEYKKLAVELDKVADDKGWLTPGNYHGWAEQWATASVHEAEKAYEPITFGAAMLKKPTDKRFVSIGITPPATYADDELVRARTQIAKGGVHLAQLLNSINWR